MEEINDIQKIIAEINRITSATRVLHPEQVILRCITFFDVALRKTKRKSLNIEVINNSLRSLLKVCDGKLSPQCSVSISRHLCDFYKIQKNPPFEETVTEFLGHMTPASTIAIGDLCEEFGQRKVEVVLKCITALKAQIGRYENLYALHRIFKSYQNYKNAISKYAYQVYQLVIKNFFSFNISCYIISFKLLRALVKNDLYLCPLSIGFSETILKKSNISQFVKNEAIKLVATAALRSNYEEAFKILLKINQICGTNLDPTNPNSTSSQNTSISLTNLSLFNSKSVVTKFFERLSPDRIISDHKSLFSFVRNSSPSSIFEIAPFLSRKDREDYFSKILIERHPSPSQVSIMKALQIDDCTTASIAYHLVNSKNKLDQEYAMSFFRTIDRENQLMYLKNSLQRLLAEKNQNKISYGDYILARSLIERVGTDEKCIKDCLKVLFDRKLYQHPMFWYLMSIYDTSTTTTATRAVAVSPKSSAKILPAAPKTSSLVNSPTSVKISSVATSPAAQQADHSSSSSPKTVKFASAPTTPDSAEKAAASSSSSSSGLLNSEDLNFAVEASMIDSAFKVALTSGCSLLVESLLLYFSKHPSEKWKQQIPVLMKYVSTHLDILTNRCILALIDLCVSIRPKEGEKRLDDGACNVFVPFFVQRFMKDPPTSTFYSTLVTKPMILFADQLNLIPRSSQAKSAASSAVVVPENQQVSRKIVLLFAELYDTLTNDQTKQTIVNNLASTTTTESHALLLQLVRNKKVKLNVDSFLTLLTGSDFLRLELTCEIISFLNPPIDKVYNFVKSFPSSSPIPFLFLSSVFCNSSLDNAEVQVPESDSYLSRFVSLFDFSVLSTNLFALHCLSALLISKSVEIIALEIGANFLTTILSLVNCKASLQPLFLILICEVFVNILPLLSVDLIGNKELCSLVLSIVESVKGCTYESAKEMYYQISTACLAYAPQFAFSYFNFNFKFPSRSSRKVRIASLDAISQSLNLTSNRNRMKKNEEVNFALNSNLVASYESYVNGLKDIFVFLQQTNDDRIKECINLICSYKIPKLPSESVLSSDYGRNFDFSLIEMQFISIAKSVFIRNSLPGFADVEPSQKVKETALFCVEQIKNIRDRFVCVSKSLEMGITTPTFVLLSRILQSDADSVWQFKNELMNIAKYALSINLNRSKQFLLILASEETIFDLFGLLVDGCSQRSADFFELATKVCLIASQKVDLSQDKSQNLLRFAQMMSPLLCEIVENLMIHANPATFDAKAKENNELLASLKHLNAFVFPFYARLYSSFVWAEKASKLARIQNESLFSFLTLEVLATDEFWRIQGAINGLSAIVKFFGSETPGIPPLVDEALQAILRLSRSQQLLLKGEIYDFTLHVIRMHNANNNNNNNNGVYVGSKALVKSCFEKVEYLAKFIEFDCEIISTLMRELHCNCEESISSESSGLDNDFLKCCRLKEDESDEKKLALFLVAIEKVPRNPIVPAQLINDLSSSSVDENDKYEFYRICVRKNFEFNFDSNEVSQLKKKVLRYVYENIGNDRGRSIVNEAIQSNCESILPQIINVLLHKFGDEKDALLLAVFAEKFAGNQRIAESLSRFALNVVDGGDVGNAMIVLRTLLKVNKKAVLVAWKGVGEEKQKKILSLIESKI